MEVSRIKIVAAAIVLFLLFLIIVLRVTIGASRTFFLIAGADLAVILGIFIWALFQHLADRSRRLLSARRLAVEGEELRVEYSFLKKVAGVPVKFRYQELQIATDNFQAKIGQGASASVFKGILYDGTPVAVKRIEGAEHGENEFRAEVRAIASVQHVNLLRLLGYCCLPEGPRYLVYDFVQNGSLDNWIFQDGGSRGHRARLPARDDWLPWALRYRVAIDVAKALAYLHHDCRSKILHLDVKPENILLDDNFRAVVNDFGLSKLMGKDESRVVTTIRGTRGYLAPEWLLENGITEKSDIYSFGMVLLEMVGGRRNVLLVGDGVNSERRWSYFPRIVNEKVKEGKVMEVVDERLIRGGDVDEKEVTLLVNVALWCIQEDAKLRPSMERVVAMLEGRVPVDVPPETEMVVVDLLSIGESSADGAGAGSGLARRVDSQLPTVSTYSLTMSVLSGR